MMTGWWIETVLPFHYSVRNFIISSDWHVFQKVFFYTTSQSTRGCHHQQPFQSQSSTGILWFYGGTVPYWYFRPYFVGISPCIGLIWLVVWNMFFIFPHIGNNHPDWLSYFFTGVAKNHQPAIILPLYSQYNPIIIIIPWYSHDMDQIYIPIYHMVLSHEQIPLAHSDIP